MHGKVTEDLKTFVSIIFVIYQNLRIYNCDGTKGSLGKFLRFCYYNKFLL